jgi:hypothetical protein
MFGATTGSAFPLQPAHHLRKIICGIQVYVDPCQNSEDVSVCVGTLSFCVFLELREVFVV